MALSWHGCVRAPARIFVFSRVSIEVLIRDTSFLVQVKAFMKLVERMI